MREGAGSVNSDRDNRSRKSEKIVPTVCSSHCGGACLFKAHVVDGVGTRMETDDGEEPQFRGCARGHAYRQRLYAPDRLKYPMKRIGERGEGIFERVSWDEALETVAKEAARIRDTYGNKAVMLWLGGGDATWVHGFRTVMRFLALFGGCCPGWGQPSFEGADFAAHVHYGAFLGTGNTRDDLVNSHLIIFWGWDPATTIQGTNTCWYLAQAKEAGCRMVVVDPRYTDTAATFGDQWIPIRPGTDAAMLTAMAYVMVRENLQDQVFLDRYTVGFQQYREYLVGDEDGVPKTPEWAEAITGVPASVIQELANDYATVKPAALMTGIAPGRVAFGEQYHRAAMTLAAMTGNIGNHGGYPASAPQGTVAPWNMYPHPMGEPWLAGLTSFNAVAESAPPTKRFVPRGQLIAPTSSASVHQVEYADAILQGTAGGYHADYKMLIVMLTNPVNQMPNSNKVARALKATGKLETIVVMEQFMTATAKYADILLPTSTILEKHDLVAGASGTPFYGLMPKVVDPLYESRSLYDIVKELAQRLGLTTFGDKSDEEWVKEYVSQSSQIPDYDTLKRKGAVKPVLPEPHIAFAAQISDVDKNPFPTPSGKIEIYSQQMAERNDPHLPPVAKYLDPWEGPTDPLTQKYPLQLVTTHTRRRALSQWETIPWLRELGPHGILMNTTDAEARGIADGDRVRVFNDRGQIIVGAKVTERIMPGVADLPHGAWYAPDKSGVDVGGCANTLTRDELSPGGAFPYNSCLVQIEKL